MCNRHRFLKRGDRIGHGSAGRSGHGSRMPSTTALLRAHTDRPEERIRAAVCAHGLSPSAVRDLISRHPVSIARSRVALGRGRRGECCRFPGRASRRYTVCASCPNKMDPLGSPAIVGLERDSLDNSSSVDDSPGDHGTGDGFPRVPGHPRRGVLFAGSDGRLNSRRNLAAPKCPSAAD